MIRSAFLLLVLVLAILGIQAYVNNVVLTDVALPRQAALDTYDQKSVDVSLEMVRTINTMVPLIFGAVGAFWFTKHGAGPIPVKIWRLGFAAAVFAGMSVCFGFIFERNLVTMLNHKIIDFQTVWIVWPLYAQMLAFLSSLFALMAIFFEGTT